MNYILTKAAKALIDADPCISGYHETHIALKLPIVETVLSAIEEPSPEMMFAALEAIVRGQSSITKSPSALCVTIWKAMVQSARAA